MSENWYKTSHEWVYKDLEPHIIADTFLDDHRQGELQDYKFWCFDGEPKVMYFTNKTENEDEIYENFFGMDFRPLPIDHGFPRFVPEYQRPANFEKMKDLARQLANGIPFVRIDFFDIEGHIYFGEFTFYDWGGMKSFGKEQDDRMLGSWITLPQISKS